MRKLIFIVGLLFPWFISAQKISGKVTNDKNVPLFGANIYWLGTNSGTVSSQQGEFEISLKNITDKRLVATHVGYVSDTILISDQSFVEFRLKENKELDEVLIKKRRPGVFISDGEPLMTYQITQTELEKAACCDLAGCFGTQITVQPHSTNVITDSKELRILGLSGVYNQVLVDGFPIIKGLSQTYGISNIPGTLVKNIYISKGTNSVLQGYESISGQVNVETKDPGDEEKLLLNAYINSFLEKQFNANYTAELGKWSNLTAVHMVQPADRTDRDKDRFMDLPLVTRYMIFNKLKYGKEVNWGWNHEISLRFVNEERIGGQMLFNENDKGSNQVYGQSIKFNQPEIWAKTGYRINDTHNFSVYTSVFHQDQNSYFGTTKYTADQLGFYGKGQYEFSYNHNDLKTGISFRHLQIEENIAFTDNSLQRTYAGNYNLLENIPGFFAENTLRLLAGKLTWVAGIRGDHHNEFGFRFTPRTMIKYDIFPKTIIRAHLGAGWRTPKLFSENVGLLASSRDIVFSEKLQPEEAVGFGGSFIQNFETSDENFSGYFSADYYRTNFRNQFFPDYDSDPTKAFIENFSEESFSNSVQAELFMKIWKRYEFKTAYQYLEAYRQKNGGKKLLPFIPKHKIVASFSYRPLSDKFHIDMNLHWNGKQSLPDTQSNPKEFRRPDFSEAYTVVNAQFTYNFKQLELYAGIENIFDFRQKKPIIGWQDPFGPYFDTSSVWGPTKGRELYLGARFYLKMH